MTILNSFPAAPDSSSSGLTVKSLHFEAVLELGKKLVNELHVKHRTDTLCIWMAHHIAELMEAAGDQSACDLSERQTRCREAILSLWKRRYGLPPGCRPFETLEPILRTLGSLDPENHRPRYCQPVWRAVEEEDAEPDEQAAEWLNLGESLDHSAKLLIGFCLSKAAESARENASKWCELAHAVGADDDVETPVIRFVSESDISIERFSADEQLRRRLEERINKLEAFTGAASALISDLKRSLEGASAFASAEVSRSEDKAPSVDSDGNM